MSGGAGSTTAGRGGRALRLIARVFPARFRDGHLDDLIELYDDYGSTGRRFSRVGLVWDLLRNGFGARFDDWRGAPRPPRRPRRTHSLDWVWRDLRFAARMLRRSPAFTVVALASLAIGIAANTAVFSLIDTVSFRALQVESPDELVVLGWRWPPGTSLPDISINGWLLGDDDGGRISSSFSLPAFERLSESSTGLRSWFAFSALDRLNVRVNDAAELASGQLVTGGYYAALGLLPATGRLLVAADDDRSAAPVAVISHGYWRRRFGEDPRVVGTTLPVNGTSFRIVGVTPQGFHGTLQVSDDPDVTLPMAFVGLVTGTNERRYQPDYWGAHVMARLAAGVHRPAAEAALAPVFRSIVEGQLFPEGMPADVVIPDLRLHPGRQGLTEDRGLMRQPLRTLSVVVGVLLLIVCVNVANLALARTGSRRREVVLRMSLGAGRFRVIRQLMTESLLLAGLAAVAGVVLATWGRAFFLGALVPPDLAVGGMSTNLRVLGFSATMAAAVAVVFGLGPALRVSQPALAQALQSGTAGSGRGRRQPWVARFLLVAQVALSVVLLVAAGLFVRTLANLESNATGFLADGVMLFSVDATLNDYEPEQIGRLFDELLVSVASVPGVRSVTHGRHSPVSGRFSSYRLQVPTYTPADGERMSVFGNVVGPGFFETFGIPILLGRGIDESDREGTPMVAVVNETFVERYIADGSPIGTRLGIGRGGQPDEYEIVGVVPDVQYQQLRDEPMAGAHIAARQHVAALTRTTFGIKASGGTTALMSSVRAVVRQTDPAIPIFEVRSLDEQKASTLGQERLMARLSATLSALALVLASIGLYGMLTYAIVQRTREFGVRMALGAHAGNIMRLVMAELGTVLVGVAVGVVAALWAMRVIESQIYGLSTTDPLSIGLAVGVLLAVATVATFLPARRAGRVDPAVALRYD